MRLLRYLAVLGLAMSSRAATATAVAATDPAIASASDGVAPMLMMLVSLAIVLAAIGGIAFVFKRFGMRGPQAARMMRVVGQLPLGARERVTVVELGDQWLVLGVTAQQITLLTQTARKESDPASPALAQVSFSRLLNLARGKHDPS